MFVKECNPLSIGISSNSTPLFINRSQSQFSQLSQPQLPFKQFMHKLKPYISTLSSISGSSFATIFQRLSNPNSIKFKEEIPQILGMYEALLSLSWNYQDVINELKKTKVDSIYVLCLCWTSQKKQQYFRIVRLMVDCFPAQLLLSGKVYLKKWEELIQLHLEQIKLRKEIDEVSLEGKRQIVKPQFKDILLLF